MLSRGLLAGVAESHRLGSPDGSRLPGVLGPWNGELRDPALLQELGKRFGSEYVWSASQLESYAQNPFMFFLQRVLHIEEKEEAEEDTSILTLGTFGHTLLERFHRELQGRLPVELAVASEALDRIASAAFAEAEQEGLWRGLPAMWVVRRRQTVENVRQYLEWELPKLQQWVPRYFEFSFGYDSRETARLEWRDPAGQTSSLRLRGKIDRVDVRDSAHRVVDYKTSTIPAPKGYLDGATLQSALYMAALEASGLTPAEAEYRSIRQRKASARIEWGDRNATLALSLAHSIPARVRSGKFEPCAANSCGWKSYWPGGIALVRVTQALADGECRFDG
jgi:RecB family exonuclease